MEFSCLSLTMQCWKFDTNLNNCQVRNYINGTLVSKNITLETYNLIFNLLQWKKIMFQKTPHAHGIPKLRVGGFSSNVVLSSVNILFIVKMYYSDDYSLVKPIHQTKLITD